MTEAQLRYRKYLESDHWRGLRAEAFRKYGRKCHWCPKKFSLEVHHVRYRHPWESCTVDDVMVLCFDCHRAAHAPLPKPKVAPYASTWTQRKREMKQERRRQKGLRRLKRKEEARANLHRLGIKPTKQNLRKNPLPRFWPGMYEGKPLGGVAAEVGLAVKDEHPLEKKTPDCFNPRKDIATAAVKHNGKLAGFFH